jgi:hypothetical protein
VPTSRAVDLYFHSHIRLHGLKINWAQGKIGVTLETLANINQAAWHHATESIFRSNQWNFLLAQKIVFGTCLDCCVLGDDPYRCVLVCGYQCSGSTLCTFRPSKIKKEKTDKSEDFTAVICDGTFSGL